MCIFSALMAIFGMFYIIATCCHSDSMQSISLRDDKANVAIGLWIIATAIAIDLIVSFRFPFWE